MLWLDTTMKIPCGKTLHNFFFKKAALKLKEKYVNTNDRVHISNMRRVLTNQLKMNKPIGKKI